MATELMNDHVVLDESKAKRILETPRTLLPERSTLHDITLSRSQRIADAKDIIRARKK